MTKRAMLVLTLVTLGVHTSQAAEKNIQEYTLRIRVLQNESTPYTTTSGGNSQTNCTATDYSAHCNTTTSNYTWRHVQNTMLVEASDGRVYTIACTASVRWSKCRWLQAGDVFPAKWDKGGLSVLYHYGNHMEKEGHATYAVLGSRPIPHSQAVVTNKESVSTASVPVGNTTLDISSTPPNADIQLDGAFAGNTPSSLGVGAGEHTITITKSGYSTWERRIRTGTGNVKLVAGLEPSTAPVSSDAAQAAPAYSSAPHQTITRSTSTNESTTQLPPASTVVTAHPEVKPAILKQQTSVPAITSQPEVATATSSTGKISITSAPDGAEIFVDSVGYGHAPAILELSAGSHSVQLVMNGHSDWVSDVQVKASSIVNVTANLKK